ncbi:putative ABC transporter permease protein [Gordonia hirsuta DSM 44140 = NBRC 16056]|uniref:Putative ABC transporter permease protein n=1 Tax=Gordonia hirsuta DSM 44140 = NBRC 16056 TaxID=1121927 RepID=L7L8K7_9ACTN|nr:iron chelate uptake ABC transporter family permease subunit [Gordonia hirsuta]GAC57071.1 putative ABC transporter permease protein [Gordonia hirsuta DSM 44140 = NBRC 16056]
MRGRWLLPALAVSAILLLLGSLLVGEYHITVAGLLSGDPQMWRMFFISRVPRTLALIFAGVAMSFSGVIMMRLTQNRFVEPTTAGTAEWAGLGVLLCWLLIPESTPLVKMVVATATALLGTMVFLAVISGIRARNSAIVPLVGIMMGAVVGAAATFLANKYQLLQSMTAWRSGGFNSVVRGFYEPLWAVAVIAAACFVLANYFTVAGLGRDVAVSLGVRYGLVLTVGVCMVALASGVTSVVVGFIPFLGLVVPNLISALRGDDLRSNLPWIGVLATVLIVGCDLIGRVVVAPMEIPVSVTLGVVGSVTFLAILLSGRSRVAL